MPMTAALERRILTVRLMGEIDHHAARSLMQELEREIERSFPRTLVLDCSGLSFMDSSGIAVILRTWRRMQETGGTLRVEKVPRQAAKVLCAANLHKMVEMTFQ